MQSIRRPSLTEIVKAAPAVANEWLFNPSDILNSPRKVRGKFHTPKIDRDNEYIEKTAVQTAVPDFMHLPILHDFHKERTVGIVTRVVELSDGSFDFEGLIKATDDCNDVWELIAKGNYNQVSIYGKRTCGSRSCNVKPEQRMEPCVTTGVRLDSISVCDENARNDGTSLMVAKGAKVVFNATEEIIKAETTDSSLMHTVTDYPRKFGSDGLPRTKKKCTATCPQYERDNLGKGDVMDVNEEEKGRFSEGITATAGHEKMKAGGKMSDPEVKEGWQAAGKIRRKEIFGKSDGAESAEGKLDTLITLVEKLVQKDVEEKGTPYDNNHSDKYPDVGSAPESADMGRELPDADEREYGDQEEKGVKYRYEIPDLGDTTYSPGVNQLSMGDGRSRIDRSLSGYKNYQENRDGEIREKPYDEEKAGNYQLGSQRAASKLDMAAVSRQGETRAADPDVDITHYASKYHLKKEAEKERGKEGFVQNEAHLKQQPGQGIGEVPGEEKAGEPKESIPKDYAPFKPKREDTTTAPIPNPDEKRPDEQLDYVAERRADKEAMIEQQVGQDSERQKRSVERPAPVKPAFSNQEHSSRSQTPTEDSEARIRSEAPSGAREFSGIPYKTEGDAKQSQYPQGGTKKPNPDKTPIPRSGERAPDQATYKTPPWESIGGAPKGTERSKPLDRPEPDPKPGSYESNAAPADRAKERMVEGKFTEKKPNVRGGESEKTPPVTDKERYGKHGVRAEPSHPEDATEEPRFGAITEAPQRPPFKSPAHAEPAKKIENRRKNAEARKNAPASEEKSDGPVDVEEAQILNEGEDKNEMPDIDSRIDRLIQVISQLVQSDTQVHNKMEQKGAKPGTAPDLRPRGEGDDFVEQKFMGQGRSSIDRLQGDHNKLVERFTGDIQKGTETMKDEEVDTLVKAKVAAEVEAISKAYQVQVDELKARLDKMEKETIEKSGVVVVMREGDETLGTPYLTNAAAISAAKKTKVA